MSLPRLLVTASPHLTGPATTPKIMWNVVASLVPIIAASALFFGADALLVIAAATVGALITERAFGSERSLLDGSGMITGLLLGLTLPPGFPLWMAFLGGFVAIAFGKLIFGGLGQNIFNPALLGRAFLQAAFPVAITTWPTPGGPWLRIKAEILALPFFGAGTTDTVTGATPLGLWKFERVGTEMWDLMLGTTGGSLGETSALLIIVCGGYLAARNFLNWRIPISIFLTVALLAGALKLVDPGQFPSPLFMLFSGGLMLGVGLGGGHPHLGRAAGGRDVRDPDHERAGALHQSSDAAEGVRDPSAGVGDVSDDGASRDTGAVRRELPQAPGPPVVRSSRLLATLGTAGALAGLLIVFVHQATQPAIQAHKALMLALAVEEVLKAPYRYDTLYVHEDALTARPPEGVDVAKLERVFLGYRESGERIGFAISGAEPGFQDVIELIFGYDAETRQVLGMKVLASKETPGLGDKIEKDADFVAEFDGAEVPLVGVKPQRATGAANEIDMITGATISSRTVIAIINHRLERLGPMLESYRGEAN